MMTATRVPDYPSEEPMKTKCFCEVISANYVDDEIFFIRLDSRNGNSWKEHDPKESNLCYESVMKKFPRATLLPHLFPSGSYGYMMDMDNG